MIPHTVGVVNRGSNGKSSRITVHFGKSGLDLRSEYIV